MEADEQSWISHI